MDKNEYQIRPGEIIDVTDMWQKRGTQEPLRSKTAKIPPGCTGFFVAVGPRETLSQFDIKLVQIPWDSSVNKIGDVYIQEDGHPATLGKVRKTVVFENGNVVGEYVWGGLKEFQTIKVVDYIIDELVISTPGAYYLVVDCGPDRCDTPLVVEFSLSCCCQSHTGGR